MSEFDKEKEREKLRKKFEAEEARRETTEQMSELLLKGATMLNVHCEECASPIFRHEGEEFCPTCGRTVDQIQTTGPTGDGATDTAPQAASEPTTAQPPTEEPSPEPSEPAVSPSEPAISDGEVSTVGESLTATIARLADRAATSEDPRQAKELLEAAHQAAETLELLRNH